MTVFPAWLHLLATGSLLLAGGCAAIIAIDEIRSPQEMWIMNLVWPLTALFGSLLWFAAYWSWGRMPSQPEGHKPSLAVAVMKGASHCGAGCTMGDLVVEWAAYLFPVLAVWSGWHS